MSLIWESSPLLTPLISLKTQGRAAGSAVTIDYAAIGYAGWLGAGLRPGSGFQVTVFKGDGVGANESPQPFQGQAEITLSASSKLLAWFEPQACDQQFPFLTTMFHIDAADEAIFLQHGEHIIAVSALWRWNEDFNTIVEVEHPSGAEPVADQRIEGAQKAQFLGWRR